MTVNKKRRPRKSREKREAEKRREYIFSVAFEVAKQIGSVVSGGIDGSSFKLRDVTGALKDLRDILDVRSGVDDEEREVRLEKLRREISKSDEKDGLTVVLEGVDEAWGT